MGRASERRGRPFCPVWFWETTHLMGVFRRVGGYVRSLSVQQYVSRSVSSRNVNTNASLSRRVTVRFDAKNPNAKSAVSAPRAKQVLALDVRMYAFSPNVKLFVIHLPLNARVSKAQVSASLWPWSRSAEYACHHRNNKLSTFPRRGGSKSHAHPSQTQHHTKYRKRKCCSCSDLKNVHAAMLEASESISPIDEKYPSLMELNANLLYHHKKKQTDKNLPHVVGTCCPCAGDSRVPPNHRAENFPELSVESKTRVIHRFKEEISLGENGMVDDDTEADEGLYDRDPDDNESSEEFISPAYVRQTYVKA
ncbi:hypothetical protein AAMO2058_001458200 [Amorphochlora amoebiformis]